MFRSATITKKRTLVIWTVVLMTAAFLAATARAAAITYDVIFTDYASGPPLQWLDKKGFKPERDAANSRKVVVSHAGNGLVLETRKQAAGLLLSQVQIHTYSTIRITWGVNAFPPGASYANGVRSEAIMVYVFFGTEKISSGHFLVPDRPVFHRIVPVRFGSGWPSLLGPIFQGRRSLRLHRSCAHGEGGRHGLSHLGCLQAVFRAGRGAPLSVVWESGSTRNTQRATA